MAKHSLKSGIQRQRFQLGEERHTKLGEIAPEAKQLFPFYFKLKYDDPLWLLKWRLYVRKRCASDLAFREQLWEMARRDVAFFAVTFAVIFEPRPHPRWLPFNLWTDQVSLLAYFEECFGARSLMVNKTRGIGLSWITVLYLFHAWLFKPEVAIAVLSADKTRLEGDDANSLIGKFQYLFDGMPAWAQFTKSGNPLMVRSKERFSLINVGMKSVIQGYVSTSVKLRGLRFTAIFADEFAFYDRTDQAEWLTAAGGTTHSMWLISTWNGFDDSFHNLFYENREDEMLRVNVFWHNNYERWQGAYKIVNGQVVYIDQDYKHPPDYQFGLPDLLDPGMLRSPWVDAELSQPRENPLNTLRDLYGIEVAARTNAFFDKFVQDLAKQTIRDPDYQGLLDVVGGKVRIHPSAKSVIRTWGLLHDDGAIREDKGPFIGFCDLSQGVGAAYSVFSVLDQSGEQVLEYGVNDLNLTDFAANVVYICRYLCGDNGDGWVLLDAEANGPFIAPFVTEVRRLNYGNMHLSSKKYPDGKGDNDAKYFGTNSREKGMQRFNEMSRAIQTMEIVIKSENVVNDIRLFSISNKGDKQDGQPVFPRGRKEGHGDFCQAIAGAWNRAKDRVSIAERNTVKYTEAAYSQRLVHEFKEQELWSDNWK